MQPKDIQIVIFDGLPVEPFCKAWAEQLCDTKMASEIWRGRPVMSDMAVWRNLAVDWFLKKTDKQALLFLEHSKIPDHSTLPVIVSDADIVGAEYIGKRCEGIHTGDGCQGTGCLKMSRTALEKIERPHFNYQLSSDGLKIEKCSCMWFCERAMEAGYFPVQAGSIGRMTKMIVRHDKTVVDPEQQPQ